MKDVWELYDRCVEQLDALSIDYGTVYDITVNSRAKSFWGRCSYNRKRDYYVIEISDRLLADDVDDMATLDTLMHEILHTCSGCMNHGAQWKAYAEMVNNAYGYNVKRCTSATEKNMEEEEPTYHYTITCDNCHTKWKYVRHSKIVSACEKNNAKCSCGSVKFTVIHI